MSFNLNSDNKDTYIVHEYGDEIIHDIVEKTEKYRKIEDQVDKEAQKRIEDMGLKDKMGSCYSFWDEKQKILKQKYGIKWRTPAELNPFNLFD